MRHILQVSHTVVVHQQYMNSALCYACGKTRAMGIDAQQRNCNDDKVHGRVAGCTYLLHAEWQDDVHVA